MCIVLNLFLCCFQDQNVKGFGHGLEPEMVMEEGINSSSGSVTGEKEENMPSRRRCRRRKLRSEESKENHPPIAVILYYLYS